MNLRDLFSAFVGGVLSIVGAILVGSFTPLGEDIVRTYVADKLFEPIPQTRREAISGLWIAQVRQEFQNKPVSYTGELELRVEGRKLVGELRIPPPDDKTKLIRFDVSGGFIYDRFARLEYKLKDQGSVYFGSIIVELHPLGKELNGNFIVFGAYSNKIVSGSVKAKKSE